MDNGTLISQYYELELTRALKACEALAKLADAAMIYDEDGVDIYFLNDPTIKGESLKVRMPYFSPCVKHSDAAQVL